MSKAESQDFKVRKRKVTDYQPDGANANRGTRRGQRMISTSYKQHGAGRSWLVDKDDMLIAGNHAQQGAIEAGLDEVVEIEVLNPRVQVVVKRPDLDLDDGESNAARQLAFGDNRSGQVSLDWNPEQVKEYEDLLLQGDLFRQDELDELLAQADVEAMVEQSMAAGSTSRDNLNGKASQVDVALLVEDLATVEAAIKLARTVTGSRNRGKCMAFICAEFAKLYSDDALEALLDETS